MHRANIVFRMTPIPTRLEIAEPQFFLLTGFDACDPGSDLARDEFKAASRTLMIEQDAAQTEHSVRFPVVARELKAGNFADAVWRTRMKRSRLFLRHFAHLAEHF